jgi:hypothetical protein
VEYCQADINQPRTIEQGWRDYRQRPQCIEQVNLLRSAPMSAAFDTLQCVVQTWGNIMSKVNAGRLKVGDKIMPPEREVRLWMRRRLQERNLAESALYLTITEIHEGATDKLGRWLIITTQATTEWNEGYSRPTPFRFKVRPQTPWPVVQS